MPKHFLQRSRHGTIYYFRRRVPNDIRQATGQQQIYKSLSTANLREAIIRARVLACQTDQLFVRIRSMPQQDWNGFKIGYTLKVEFNDHGKPTSLTLDAEPHEHAAAQRALETAMGAPTGPHGGSQDASHLLTAPEPLSIANAVQEYLTKSESKSTTLASYRAKLAYFETYFGSEFSIFSVDQRKFVAFAEHVKQNSKWAIGTQGDYITIVGAFLKWHRIRAGLPALTAATLKPKESMPDSEKRDAYTLEQLSVIFRNAQQYRAGQPHKFWVTIATAFLGCRLEELAQLDLRNDLRLDETSQIWYFDLNETADADGVIRKSMKKKASYRRIPIHSALVSRGFIEYLRQQLKEGATRPFEKAWAPHIDVTTATPKWNHAISKWGGRELRRLETEGKIVRGELTYFHSFRHTFARTLAGQSVPEEIRAAVQGQEFGGINFSTYSKLRHNHNFLNEKIKDTLHEYEKILAESES